MSFFLILFRYLANYALGISRPATARRSGKKIKIEAELEKIIKEINVSILNYRRVFFKIYSQIDSNKENAGE